MNCLFQRLRISGGVYAFGSGGGEAKQLSGMRKAEHLSCALIPSGVFGRHAAVDLGERFSSTTTPGFAALCAIAAEEMLTKAANVNMGMFRREFDVFIRLVNESEFSAWRRTSCKRDCWLQPRNYRLSYHKDVVNRKRRQRRSAPAEASTGATTGTTRKTKCEGDCIGARIRKL
jgi:hypothetical protein